MKLVVADVAVAGAHAPLLLPTSLTARTGGVTLVVGDQGDAHVALALVLGGQLAPSSGSVLLGGSADPEVRRRKTALVDVPRVTEPEAGIPISAVIGEELALSGQPARAKDVDAFLDERDAGDRGRDRWEHLDPATRTAWLAELASWRGEVDVLVLAHPDRFGGDPFDWWQVATDLAEDGRAVIVQCTYVSARVLDHRDYFELGARA